MYEKYKNILQGDISMKLYRLIPLMAVAAFLSFNLAGCGTPSKQEKKSSLQETTENQNYEITQKDPIDLVVEGKDKVASAVNLSVTIESKINEMILKNNVRIVKKEDGSEDGCFKVEQHSIDGNPSKLPENMEMIIKDGFTYFPSSKSKMTAMNILTPAKNSVTKLLSALTKENIKEIKEESNEGGLITYEVLLNDLNVILNTVNSTENESNVVSANIKVTVKNNGMLQSLSINDLKTSDENQKISSCAITVNAINDDVEPIELPDDVDSYKDMSSGTQFNY